MSSYTSLDFYRPTAPPIITGEQLARFVRAFAKLGVSTDGYPMTIELKFGKAIDQDEKPSLEYEQVYKTIWAPKESDLDLEEERRSLKSVSSVLSGKKKTIYRAFIGLGAATKEIFDHLARIKSPENETDLTLDSWSLQIDPIMSSSLGSDDQFFVGWISVGISGYGYLYPWTPADLVRRAESHPGIRKVKMLCQKTWPVESGEPNQQVKKLRKRMGALWPYDRVDIQWDWYWGIEET